MTEGSNDLIVAFKREGITELYLPYTSGVLRAAAIADLPGPSGLLGPRRRGVA